MIKYFIFIKIENSKSITVKNIAKDFLIQILKNITTKTERTAAKSLTRYKNLFDKKRYFKYNVEQGLQNMNLKKYRKQSKIETII